VFVVDADGLVAAKFEGLVSAGEVESVLTSVLTSSPAAPSPAAQRPQ
jgi:hypothetical protein